MLQPALHLGRWCFRRLLGWAPVLLLAAWLCAGCGGSTERTVRHVTLLETQPSEVEVEEALEGLGTAEPVTLLGVVRERYAYDATLLGRDLERIERFYRARGYYEAKVMAARVRAVKDEREVDVEIHVTPGPRVKIRNIKTDPRLLFLPSDAAFDVKREIRLVSGAPFEESMLDDTRRDVTESLKENGYAYAKVQARATVDLNARAADIVIEGDPGRPATFGEIRISGLKQVPEDKVRAALGLWRGQRYSETARQEAAREVNALGKFSRVDVAPDLSHPELSEVPLIVTLEEDKLRKLTLGGGTTIDSLRFSVHLRTGWEHKNFLGGARRLSVEGKPGLDFFPTRLESFDEPAAPTRLLFRNEAKVELEQPSIFGGRTKGFLQASYDIFPLLYPLVENSPPEQERIIGYHQPEGRAGLRRSWWSRRISIEPSYNVQANIPFTYQRDKPQGLDPVLVSFPRLSAGLETQPGDIFDEASTRDLRVSFHNSIEIAGLKLGSTHFFGGSISDVKLEPELRVFMPIDSRKRDARQPTGNWTLATRFKLGFVVLPDYGGTLRTQGDDGSPEATDASVVADQQKLLLRAFYSGGPNSNRGYAYRAISPHGPVGFLIPTGLDCSLEDRTVEDLPLGCIRPLGGFTLWEASLELRWIAAYPLSLVGFLDASDVTRDIGAIQFRYPHLSAGPGVRYDTPVGALRLDVGIRLPGLQAIGQDTLPIEHGQERPLLFGNRERGTGLPVAVHLAIGDAF